MIYECESVSGWFLRTFQRRSCTRPRSTPASVELYSVKPRRHQQQCRSNVPATFDFVAKNGNNVERVFRKLSSFRQSRSKLNMFDLFRYCRKKTKFRSTLLLKWQHRYRKQRQCRSNVRLCRSSIRLCRKNRSTCSIRQCFDIVAGVDGA